MTTASTIRAIIARGDGDKIGNPEWECFCLGSPSPGALFDAEPQCYTFRRVAKPTMRPWTAAELWEHRSCWFREKSEPHRIGAIKEFNNCETATVLIGGFWRGLTRLFKSYEYLSPSGEWLPCGVMEQA